MQQEIIENEQADVRVPELIIADDESEDGRIEGRDENKIEREVERHQQDAGAMWPVVQAGIEQLEAQDRERRVESERLRVESERLRAENEELRAQVWQQEVHRNQAAQVNLVLKRNSRLKETLFMSACKH